MNKSIVNVAHYMQMSYFVFIYFFLEEKRMGFRSRMGVRLKKKKINK